MTRSGPPRSGRRGDRRWRREGVRAPAGVALPSVLRAVRSDREMVPARVEEALGTVTLSAVGMLGKGAGWGIPPSSPSICWVTVGGIGEKRADVEESLAAREYLSLTVSCDHRMIDGAPAARFTERLKDLIENGYGLPPDEEAIAEPAERRRLAEASAGS